MSAVQGSNFGQLAYRTASQAEQFQQFGLFLRLTVETEAAQGLTSWPTACMATGEPLIISSYVEFV
jgi:hypothetical protein